MESQRPTQPAPDPGLCGCDRDIFLRVWNRVMPEESPACPITVEQPEQDPASAPPPPRPRGAADAPGDEVPAPGDVPCLGSGGAADQELLREFTTRELTQWRSYQMLARRSGPGGRMLSALAGGCRRRAKRLSAALFLISGVRFWPAEQTAVPPPRSYFGALREHFLAEQDRGCAYRAAAEDCRDMCLRTLYLDLADECAEHADRIRSLLETI